MNNPDNSPRIGTHHLTEKSIDKLKCSNVGQNLSIKVSKLAENITNHGNKLSKAKNIDSLLTTENSKEIAVGY